ncbi:hypothetical protein ACKI1I_31700 [Streptomyces turgidiscabies]|uniref:hypothetical protein n=1 Tax=Streptomyces TaxID=1883 RepID=UPI0011814A90|nr:MULTISPECIES: hypothetical protein [Streptomyces]MDX3499185.1 hypothetical protein [Streptomyces turgidiscabies]
MRRDRVAVVATLTFFGALSAWLLPDGWRLASLPLALICATIAQRSWAGALRRGLPEATAEETATSDVSESSWNRARRPSPEGSHGR